MANRLDFVHSVRCSNQHLNWRSLSHVYSNSDSQRQNSYLVIFGAMDDTVVSKTQLPSHNPGTLPISNMVSSNLCDRIEEMLPTHERLYQIPPHMTYKTYHIMESH